MANQMPDSEQTTHIKYGYFEYLTGSSILTVHTNTPQSEPFVWTGIAYHEMVLWLQSIILVSILTLGHNNFHCEKFLAVLICKKSLIQAKKIYFSKYIAINNP